MVLIFSTCNFKNNLFKQCYTLAIETKHNFEFKEGVTMKRAQIS